ncbi:hypothetical protein ACH4FX_23660 [Streptomyces sp. NPDC018019]|uniref:hypothetical protein n=1 Tax=Streptomyces sp. NPDC018019 TaxID=3365030 RepID=UPI00378C6955
MPLAVLLVLAGGSPGSAYAAVASDGRTPVAVGAPVPTVDPVLPYGGPVRCSTPGDCLPAVVTVAPGPGAGPERAPAASPGARPALPATGGGSLIPVAALGSVLLIVGAVAAAVGRDRRNRRRRAAGR